MRSEFVAAHLSLNRRRLIQSAMILPISAGVLTGAAACASKPDNGAGSPATDEEDFDDTPIDVELAESGGWAPSPYGADDQRGTLNEVTAAKTAAALGLLSGSDAIDTHNLSETLFNGFPALSGRVFEQRLQIDGFNPGPGFEGAVATSDPTGENRFSSLEERYPLNGTLQIGTQLDNLNHVAVGEMFYNGNRGSDIVKTYGTSKLGAENIGPVVTRGVLLDILQLLQNRGSNDLITASNGKPVVREDYRITVEDLRDALAMAGLSRIEPGDAVMIRTGWNQMIYTDPDRYLSGYPGIYLREARWLAQFRPAIVGADTWGIEQLTGSFITGFAQCHQEFITHHGIRMHEGVVLDGLADAQKYEFVYVLAPQVPLGATAVNAGPAALTPA